MLSDLINILHSAGLNFTARELQDILLLASRLAPPPESDKVTRPVDASPSLPNTPPEPPTIPLRADHDVRPVAQKEAVNSSITDDEQVQLHAGAGAGKVLAAKLRFGGVSPLGAPVDYRRSLHPFVRRLPTLRRTVLDEEATATNAMDTGVWIPAYQPARERWFDVTLLVESTPSVDIWHEELERLVFTFRSQSGMRAVNLYRLVATSRPYLISIPSGTVHDIGLLQRNDSRHLIVLATDGTNPDWRNGQMRTLLAPLSSSGQLSIMQLLPRHTWRHTALGEPELSLQAAYPGQPNSALYVDTPWWLDLNMNSAGLRLPALSFQASDLEVWARAVHAGGSARVSGWLVPAAEDENADAAIVPIQPDERIALYQHSVSPQAYDLAVFLSAVDPLTIPVMRLVMRAMLPNAGNDVLAEVLVGGLLEQVGARNAPRDEREYRFRPNIRELLAGALRFSEGERIERQLQLVGEQIAAHADSNHAVTAYLPSPYGKPRLSEWTLPFAEVSLRALTPKNRSTVTAAAEQTATVLSPASTAHVPIGGEFRILHLSDLHIGANPSDERARPEFGKAWEENLRTILSYGKVNLVCVSGDLTWNGSVEQFEHLSAFLNYTLAVLELDRSSLCVVPGNHDTQSGFSRPPAQDEEHQRSSYSNYRNWASSYLRRQYGEKMTNFDYGIRVTHHGAHVLVIEWDSVYRLREFDRSDEALLLLERMLRTANETKPASMRIVVSHVPLSVIPNRKRVEKLFDDMGVHLLVHSHRRPGEDGGWQALAESRTLVSRVGGTANRGNTPGDMQLLSYSLGGKNAIPQFCWQRVWSPSLGTWESGDAAYWNERGRPEHFELPALPSRTTMPFVGRQKEIEELRLALDLSHQCWIYGIAGIGKTALVRNLLSRYWSGPVAWLDGYTDIDSRIQLMRATGASYPPDVFYPRMRNELRKHRTLLVIDSVNTKKQRDIVQGMISNLKDCPILILGRMRPSVLQTIRYMPVKPLTEEEAHAVVRALSQENAVDSKVCQELVLSSKGVPRSLLSMLHAMSALQKSDVESEGRRHHHALLADAAFEATLKAYRGDRRAGVLAGGAGTGLTSTLERYLERCHERLRASHYVVLTDRRETVNQLQMSLTASPASIPPVQVPESAWHLEHILGNLHESTIVVTTVQMLSTLNTQNVACVVILFGLRLPTMRYMDRFPYSTSIVFAPFPLLAPLREESFGTMIRLEAPSLRERTYGVNIESPKKNLGFLKPGRPDFQRIAQLAQFIHKDFQQRMSSSLAAPVIITPSVTVAEFMSEELRRLHPTPNGRIINAATKAGRREWRLYHGDEKFRSDFFVVTNNQLSYGQFSAPSVCYVVCPISKATTINLLFHAGRREEDFDTPIIVDFVGIDWPHVAPTEWI
jgi:predicted MPP superfamily phosphohydrolase